MKALDELGMSLDRLQPASKARPGSIPLTRPEQRFHDNLHLDSQIFPTRMNMSSLNSDRARDPLRLDIYDGGSLVEFKGLMFITSPLNKPSSRPMHPAIYCLLTLISVSMAGMHGLDF